MLQKDRLNLGKLLRLIICISQSVLLVMPAFAEGGDLSALSQYENITFGQTYSKLSLDARLKKLEVNLFGHQESGTIESRLNKIGHAVDLHPKLKKESPRIDQQPVNNILSNSSHEQIKSKVGSEDNIQTQSNILLGKAMQAHDQGNLVGAESLFRRVIAIDPNNVDAHFNLGAIAEERGSCDLALKEYKIALSLSPLDKDLQQAVSSLQNKIKTNNLAKSNQEQQADQEKKHEQLKQLADEAATAFRNHNYDLAIKNLKEVEAQVPNDPDVQYGLAQAYRGKNMNAQARICLNKAIAADPQNATYKMALTDLSKSAGSASPDGLPPTAPPIQSNSQIANSPPEADDTPAGQITPFAPTNDIPQRYGYASSGQGYGDGSGSAPGQRISRSLGSTLAGVALGALLGHTMGGMQGSMGSMPRSPMYGGMGGLLFGRF